MHAKEEKVRELMRLSGSIGILEHLLQTIANGAGLPVKFTEEDVTKMLEPQIALYVEHYPDKVLDDHLAWLRSESGTWVRENNSKLIEDGQKLAAPVAEEIMKEKLGSFLGDNGL